MKEKELMEVLVRMNDEDKVRVMDSHSGEVYEGSARNVIEAVKGLNEAFEGKCNFTLDRSFKDTPKVIKGSIVCMDHVFQPGEVVDADPSLFVIRWMSNNGEGCYSYDLIDMGAIIVVKY